MEAPATLSAWQPGGAGALGLAGAAPVSPRRPASGAGGHEAASPAESASSSQHGLFGGFPGGGGGAEAAAQHGPAPDGASPAQQLRNLQRLYGLAGVHHHSSRTSLPDIAEEEPSPQQGGGGGGGAGLPAAGSGQGLAASGKPASKVMSEEDIFAMSGGLEIPGGSGGGEPAAAGGGGGGGMGVAGAPPLAYDLSLVGQMPAGASQSRTLFVRNIDASITDEELQAVFEVRAGGRRVAAGPAEEGRGCLLDSAEWAKRAGKRGYWELAHAGPAGVLQQPRPAAFLARAQAAGTPGQQPGPPCPRPRPRPPCRPLAR